ncbi:MAG: ribosome maturation factor RimP [Actinobacteria bacterium]|nr:ribosome maturation factor RimP [Actinomycetota bacterium]
MDDAMIDSIAALVAPLEVDLVDVERVAGVLRVTVERAGGIDLEGLTSVNRAISTWLDESDPIPGRFTLEVSSPGVERRLRTPEQFARALNEEVTVRLSAPLEGARRYDGILTAVKDQEIVIEQAEGKGERSITFSSIERARTVFHWGASPKPSPSRGNKERASQRTEESASR